MKATARRRTGYTHDIEIEGEHTLVIDEPESSGGADEGPSPTRTVAAALAACTAITIEMYAERKGWELGAVEVDADLELDAKSTIESFTVTLRIPVVLEPAQEERLLAIAGKCPVHRALSAETQVSIEDRIESA